MNISELENLLKRIPEAEKFIREIYQERLVSTLIASIKLKKKEEELEEIKSTTLIDYKTGLPNRRYADGYLKTSLSAAKRNGTPLSLLYLDLNEFKKLNDTIGHDAADEKVKEVAILILYGLRASDEAMRCGSESDEFLIGLQNTSSRGAYKVAKRIAHSIDEYFKGEITASIGVTTYNPRQREIKPEDFVREAEQDMYRTKRKRVI